ncbi:Coa1 domain-containing protein [Cephalotus follicularis]|uniref:Coa1 domain-containing protein n=1 Tax=Cephalotus follicularis TaxID=3775 RepID=A0A1Q3D684_CEPFO|nr:Coa1 domain-containing protein [Cephalotus follicularis]
MVVRRFASFFKTSPASHVFSSPKSVDEGKGKSYGRKAVSFVLITITGGMALSALDDLVIYHGCTRKAMEKASESQAIKDALGEPIKKGPWYNASLAVAHQRHSVSCTFPVTGPHGDGVVRLKAVSSGDEKVFSYLRSRDWEILVMDALLCVHHANEGKQQTMRISLLDNFPPPDCKTCTDSKPPQPHQSMSLLSHENEEVL